MASSKITIQCIVIVPDAIECVTQGISKHKEDPAMYERQRERDPCHRRRRFFWGIVVIVVGALISQWLLFLFLLWALFFLFLLDTCPGFPPPVDLVN